MNWLVTGGAGYIGAHVASSMVESGGQVLLFDDLSTGDARRVSDLQLVRGSLHDEELLRSTLRSHSIDGVIHLAAKKAVAESVERPLYYYRENVGGLISLLSAMALEGVERIVLSSSAAVYGEPSTDFVEESAPLMPINPYGETKVISEMAVKSLARSSSLQFVILRYFNVAGTRSPALRDSSTNNLIPKALAAIAAGDRARIFGTDYPTDDGTCVRDYVHVEDLAQAHVMAAKQLECGHQLKDVFNVGRGEGYSVLEVFHEIERVTGVDHAFQVASRRPGDPPHLVARVERIRRSMGWTAQYGLREMVSSAWAALMQEGTEA